MRHSNFPGRQIGALLALSGRDVSWLAEETGLSRDLLRGIVDDGSQPLTLEAAALIADALGVDLPVLIYGNEEEAVGIPQIARMLKVSTDTAYRMARSGDIPGFKLGGLWRFFPSKVKEQIERPKSDPWAQSARSRSRRRVA